MAALASSLVVSLNVSLEPRKTSRERHAVVFNVEDGLVEQQACEVSRLPAAHAVHDIFDVRSRSGGCDFVMATGFLDHDRLVYEDRRCAIQRQRSERIRLHVDYVSS